MKVSLIQSLLFALFFVPSIRGYDVGCLYPETMPDPFEARFRLIEYVSVNAIVRGIETPIVIRGAAAVSACDANCLAMLDDKTLNIFTKQRPTLAPFIPTAYHNSFSRMLCIAQCYAMIYDPAGPNVFAPFWDLWGLEGIQGVRQDVVAAVLAANGGDPTTLFQMLASDDYHPFLLGQLVGLEVGLNFKDDGWNADGSLTFDRETQGVVECTANCQPYQDIIGYYSRNSPFAEPENGNSKYIVEGRDKYWQPLGESDGFGYFTLQQHVTPHIGYTAKPMLFESVDAFGEAPDPMYDFREEALEVVNRLRETTNDIIKKQKIAFYDDKLLVRALIESEMRKQFPLVYSFEDELLFIQGIGAGEYDAILLAWREKIRHDSVRPSTVVQRWGSDILETFSGDKTLDGAMNISARDFQAFQRVMPHSEYPSASACICTAYAEFTDDFSKTYFSGQTLNDLRFGGSGGGLTVGCDPDQVPALAVSRGCLDDFTIPDMETLGRECGESRLWAGVHFSKAVSAAEDLCAGFGHMASEYEKAIRNGSTLGNKFYQGDARPECSSRMLRK